ncbi:O-antigen ligase family protein [Labilibaculum euxinus]|nr:O-antigen ligase family protein [Labilibaculum euxinus]
MKEQSQAFTMPYRLLVSLFCIYVFIRYNISKDILNRTTIKIIFLFYVLIITRIFSDTFIFPKDLGISGMTYLLRFLSMVVIPSLGFMMPLNEQNAKMAKQGIKYSCIVFILLGLVLYRDALGGDYRSSQYTSSLSKEMLITPISFSYIGLSLFCICIWEMFYKKNYKISNFLVLAISGFAMIWSGTRNSLLSAVLVVFFITFNQTKSIKSFFKSLLIWLAIIILGTGVLILSGSTVIGRFVLLFYQLRSGDSDAGSSRLEIWQNGFSQFLENPLFGSGIEEKVTKYVAHNLYLETIMQTGMFGGVVLMIILGFTYFNGKKLLSTDKGWLMIIFLSIVFTGMFSTSILNPILWLPLVAVNVNSKRIV